MDNRFWFPVKNWVEVGTTIFGPNPLKGDFWLLFHTSDFRWIWCGKITRAREKTSSEGYLVCTRLYAYRMTDQCYECIFDDDKRCASFQLIVIRNWWGWNTKASLQLYVKKRVDYFTCKKMYKILFLYVFTRFEHNVMKISEPDVQVSLGSFLLVLPTTSILLLLSQITT